MHNCSPNQKCSSTKWKEKKQKQKKKNAKIRGYESNYDPIFLENIYANYVFSIKTKKQRKKDKKGKTQRERNEWLRSETNVIFSFSFRFFGDVCIEWFGRLSKKEEHFVSASHFNFGFRQTSMEINFVFWLSCGAIANILLPTTIPIYSVFIFFFPFGSLLSDKFIRSICCVTMFCCCSGLTTQPVLRCKLNFSYFQFKSRQDVIRLPRSNI